MKNALKFKFKRVSATATRTNVVSCRYQRQQFALRLIDELMAGKRVINIDEACVSRASFIRQGWGQSGK